MGRRYIPSAPFEAALKLLKPTASKDRGVPQKAFPDPSSVESVFFGSFRTFGGSENLSNGVYTVFETGIVETWYNPEITSDCRIYLCDTGEVFEIVSRPEDINMRHQYMSFRVQKVGGKA